MKSKLTIIFRIGVLMLGISIFLTSCETDSIAPVEIIQTEHVQSAKSWFENNPGLNDYALFGVSETIDWTLAKSFEKENTVAVEVPLLLKQDFSLVTDQSNNLLDATHRLVFIKKNDSEIVSFIISISSFNQESKVVNDLDNFNYFDILNDFSGRIVVIDNASNIANINVILSEKDKTRDIEVYSKAPSIGCYEVVELFNIGPPRRTGITFCLDGGPGIRDEGSPNYPYHGGGRGSSNTTYNVRNNLTNPCAKAIFNQLEIEMIKKDLLQKIMKPTSKVNLTFAESILKLFNDSDKVDLSIANRYLENANGSTLGASIIISDSYLKNASQLSIARTMIHEMVHAYLNVKYSSPDFFDSNKGLDFRLKMDQFAVDNGYNPSGSKDDKNRFQHEFMGQYVNAMAVSLLSWDVKYGTGGIKIKDSSGMDVLNWEYYRDMAFGGLYYKDSNGNPVETDSFKALVPNKSDRDNIKQRLNNEQEGNRNSKSKKC